MSLWVVVALVSATAGADDFDSRMDVALSLQWHPFGPQLAINEYCQIIVDFPDHSRRHEPNLAIIGLVAGRTLEGNRQAAELFQRLLKTYPVTDAAGQQIALRYLDFQLRLCLGSEVLNPDRCRAVWELLLAYARENHDRVLELRALARQVKGESEFDQMELAVRHAIDGLKSAKAWIDAGEFARAPESNRQLEFRKAIQELENSTAEAVGRCRSAECIELVKERPVLSVVPNQLDFAMENSVKAKSDDPGRHVHPGVHNSRRMLSVWMANLVVLTVAILLFRGRR